MLERLQLVFNNVTGHTDIVISYKTKLNNKEFNLSSFALIQLICAIEDEFDIEIPNSQIKKFKTVKDLADYIEKVTEE